MHLRDFGIIARVASLILLNANRGGSPVTSSIQSAVLSCRVSFLTDVRFSRQATHLRAASAARFLRITSPQGGDFVAPLSPPGGFGGCWGASARSGACFW